MVSVGWGWMGIATRADAGLVSEIFLEITAYHYVMAVGRKQRDPPRRHRPGGG